MIDTDTSFAFLVCAAGSVMQILVLCLLSSYKKKEKIKGAFVNRVGLLMDSEKQDFEDNFNENDLWVGEKPRNWEKMNYNEKIRWRSVLNPLIFSRLADKLNVRNWVQRKQCKNLHLVPLIKHYSDSDDIELFGLPRSFVMIPNHSSKDFIINENGKDVSSEGGNRQITQDYLREKARHWFTKDRHRFLEFQKWYGEIRPHILIFPLLRNKKGGKMDEFMFLCFHGKVEVIIVDYMDETGEKGSYKKKANEEGKFKSRHSFNRDYSLIDVEYDWPSPGFEPPPKHKKMDEMVEIAECLSSQFEFVRVDLYLVDDKIYFGELTFSPDNAKAKFKPPEYNLKWGQKWKR